MSRMALRLLAVAAFMATAAATVTATAKADEALLQMDKSLDVAKLQLVGDAKATLVGEDGNAALRVVTSRWPAVSGVQIPAPGGKWDFSKYDYLYVDVRNVGSNQANVRCRVDSPGAGGEFIRNLLPAGPFVIGSAVLAPGQSGTIKVELRRHKEPWIKADLTGMINKPWGVSESSEANSPGAIEADNVADLLIFVRNTVAELTFEVTAIRLGRPYVSPPEILKDPAKFFPFIDEYGQYIHTDWPGKIHATEDFAKAKDAEAKDLAAHPGPANWDQYGGWKGGPQLKATGSFYVTKYNGKWWLVDPEGRLFFSNGIDCVTPGEGSTLISGREKYFKFLPGRNSEFKDFFGFGRGGASAPADPNLARYNFDFGRANLLRKYGADWSAGFADVTHRRLRSWGVNSIGAWSSKDIYSQKKTPYTLLVGGRGGRVLEASVGWWGRFPDVFDANFKAGLRRAMADQAETTAKDPWCIGYFVGNEMDWGGNDIENAQWVLSCPPDQVAKKVFLEDLKAKYGTIEKLNTAWGAAFASWDALLQSKDKADPKKAYDDLLAFTSKTAETYFKTVRDAIKEAAPNKLYLGCRFGGGYEAFPISNAGLKYCDAMSVNLYKESVDQFQPFSTVDAPMLIGEFSFWGEDRGMLNHGGMYFEGSRTQAQRAEAYKRFLQSVLRHPQFVGCHWFKYMDQATTGRGDGENFQFGFLDIADTPYWETVEACRQVAADMYEYRVAGR